nr:hypothetical protein [Micromonospora tarapacensis]
MTKQQPLRDGTTVRRAWAVAGSPLPPAQDRPVKCSGLPEVLTTSGSWASRMEAIAAPTPGSVATATTFARASGATIASELTKASQSPVASAAPMLQPPA